MGPYELQDFNLYYTLRFGYAPAKVAYLAWSAWRDKYRLAEIRKWLGDCGVEAVDVIEATIGERFVDERPEMLGRLQLGAMRRLEYKADAVGNFEVLGPVPASVVQLKDDALFLPGAYRFGEIGEDMFEQLLIDGVGDVPHRLAGQRLDEAPNIKPFETMMSQRDGPLANGRPQLAYDRLQADAMFVHRPEFNVSLRMIAPLFFRRLFEFFLSASRSSSLAASGWRGRGCWSE